MRLADPPAEYHSTTYSHERTARKTATGQKGQVSKAIIIVGGPQQQQPVVQNGKC